ncbi:MAG TPA: WG repeat-containing protein [Flavobacterium sp.]|uniref:WG repeat-containing protein n=1 Tax=Flavobacterium sp. TaxID=239 RepID=UPI002CA9CE82|nr:WG repeat-containing protein [Flavobacterium sp.]HNP31723.1 WG repeat-containing protein [Flavobacterium sp.]
MKNFLLTILLFTSYLSFSQVPNQQRDNDIKADYDAVIYETNDKTYTRVFDEAQKYGLKRNDSILLKPVYDMIQPSGDGFTIKKNGLSGYVTTNGKIILNTEFDSLGIGTKSLIVKKSGKYGVFDESGSVLLPVKYPKIIYSSGVSKVSLIYDKEKQFQFLLNDKKVDFEYDNIILYIDAAIPVKNSKQGLIVDGKLILPTEYDNISYDGKNMMNVSYVKKAFETKKYIAINISQKIFVVEKDKKFGLINDGNLLYPVIYDKINNDIYRKIITTEKDKLKGAYLVNSKKKLDDIYNDVYLDGSEFIEVKKDNLSGMFDYKLNVVLPIEYDDIQVMGFSSSGLKIIKNKKQGWTDKYGKIIIPAKYDKIDHFDGFGTNSFSNLYKVTNEELIGVIDSNNKTIIPLEFENIFERSEFICGKTKDGKFGLYKTDGTVILKPEYNFIFESVAEKVKILFAQKAGPSYTILDKNGNVVYDNIKKYGYINDEDNLLNPLPDSGKSYLFVQNDKNKFGIYDEKGESECLPLIYDGIIQKLAVKDNAYFIVQKGNKKGVVDNKNNVIIPFVYDDLSFDLIYPYQGEIIIPAQKNGKYGLISITNKEIVPFIYKDIAKVSKEENLYKAKSNNKYQLINATGKVLSTSTFDDIANFEGDEALTFNGNEMKPINKWGHLSGITGVFTMHKGYKTFEDLKQALITAMDSSNDDLLLQFCTKIAPSSHILYYLKNNIFNDIRLSGTPSQEAIANQYYKRLLEFKRTRWNDERFYHKSSLKFTDDYTLEDGSKVTNRRVNDHAFGNSLMEELLRNAIKVNGYWISTYFMKRSFRIND